MRFILNLKSLNKYIDTKHFKIEDLRTTLKLISKNCLMCCVDLKDAYFLLSIHRDHRRYLRFQWEDQLYEFNVLPFGLNTAPYVFTKFMKPVVKLLRSLGHLSTLYLDDFHLIGQTYDDCLHNLHDTQTLLTALGFIINKEKSQLTPKTKCKFLGFIIDSENLQVKLPVEKVNRIKSEIDRFLHIKRCKIRDFAKFLGLLVSACPAIEYGWLYTKALEREKFLNLRIHDDYEKFMNIPSTLTTDLLWWKHTISSSFSKIKSDDYQLEIFSDASTTGWGASCGNNTASGQWSDSEQSYHINYLEILAAFLRLKVFAKNISNCQILLRIDNTTAISYVNRMGGIQFPHLTDITKQLWQWCEQRRIFVFASYIRSSENVIADAESRRVHPDIEWELAQYAFEEIISKFGTPNIDLFASRINKKCNRYISWHADPDAWAVNAFTVSWSNFYFYAFPPFTMILKTLRKIITDKAKGILIVPLWPTQPWYPLFQSLLITEPITFNANQNLILSHHSSNHNMHSTITLVAGILSNQR